MLSEEHKATIRKLRSQGYAYLEICDEISQDIPRSSLSYICKDIPLPDTYAEKMKLRSQEHISRIQGLAKIKNKALYEQRLERIRLAAKRVIEGIEPFGVQKIHLAMLYIGEGSKYASYRGLSLGSSDPTILKIYIGLLTACYGKDADELRARVQYRADQNLNLLQEHWSTELDIPLNHFYKSSPDNRTLGKKTNTDYKGVCVVSCRGADIQLELAAIAELYAKSIWGVSSFG